MREHIAVAPAERVAAISPVPHEYTREPRREGLCSRVAAEFSQRIPFGMIPVKQVLHTDPYQVIKSGLTRSVGRRVSARDLLLAAQIAICAVLVTSSVVAVRGLKRSLHSKLGVEPRNAMLVETDLSMVGYLDNKAAAMQKLMIDAMQAIPGVTSVGLIGQYPPLHMGWNVTKVFGDAITDLRPSNAAAEVIRYSISPEYLQAAGTALLMGRTFTWNDGKDSPHVAVVNREFASRIFGSPANAIGRYYKLADGSRIQVVGIVEDGNIRRILPKTHNWPCFSPCCNRPTMRPG
jgi:MacB-like periplasmic core domain